MWDQLLRLSFTKNVLQNALEQPVRTSLDDNSSHARLHRHSNVIIEQLHTTDDSSCDYDNVDDDNDNADGSSSARLADVQSFHTASDNNNNDNNHDNDNSTETKGSNVIDKMTTDHGTLDADDNIVTSNNNENSSKIITRIECS
ncbi:unnamed protein product [Anisakis simplex]|uniref:Rab GTPase domain-containing protein n=1 Tax=Anisakis simplex TaxID=6269 RepID=A0A0M3JV35_ANISI|nr:unnamed protein product [Anisakis simplex]